MTCNKLDTTIDIDDISSREEIMIVQNDKYSLMIVTFIVIIEFTRA